MTSSFGICTWNVRGLGNSDKCMDVRTNIEAMQPRFLALQETKLVAPALTKTNSFLPPRLRSFVLLDSVGASGGICSAWDDSVFSLTSSFSSTHVLSIDLNLCSDNSAVRVSNIYAPCAHAAKVDFLSELSAHAPSVSTP